MIFLPPIFKPAEEVNLIVKEVIQLKKEYGKPYVVWMQLGMINEDAAEEARKKWSCCS
ncbi:TPA: hypothetical protein EYP70_03645 [Candidatus Bathyarchaeota archaeon]|nr:hypothetical protein [Candidatus Bathyarchaeota archaeon]